MINIEDLKCSNCRWLVGDLMCLNRASELHEQDVTNFENEANKCDQFFSHNWEDNCCNNDEDTESLQLND